MKFFYQNKTRSPQKFVELIGLGFLIIFFIAGNLTWLKLDTSPATDPDANLYMERTLAFIDRPAAQNITQMWQSIEGLHMEGRPPLYQLISVPLVLLFGRSMDSGVYVNLLFAILLFVSVYNIGKLTVDGNAGLLAAIITAGYPTLISLSHNYRPYFAVGACVALNIWLLLLLQKERSVSIAWLFGLSLAFGFWIYPLFLWVSPIPAAIFCLYITFFQPRVSHMPINQFPAWLLSKVREPMVLYGLFPASLVSISFVLVWYRTNAAKLLIIIQNWARSSAVTDFRGAEIITLGFNDVHPSIGWYILTSPNAMSSVFTLLLFIGMVACLLRGKFSDLVLMTFFVIGYFALSLQGGLGWRYFSMLLPVAAVLTGVWIGRIQNRFLSSFLFLLCITTSVFNFSIVNWGRQPWNDSVADFLGVVKGDGTAECSVSPGMGFCPSPPVRADWHIYSILRNILDDPDCEKEECDMLVVTSTSYIHWTVFTYYLKQDFSQLSANILSSGNPIMGIPLNLQGLLNSQYLIYENISMSEENGYEDYLIRFLSSPPAAFANAHKEVAEFKLPNGNTAKVIKRVMPPTVVEAEQVIAAIDIPEKYKIMQYDVLASLYAREGDLEKAQLYYQEGMSTGDIFKRFALTDIQHIETLIAYQKAINEYQAILESDPDNYEAHTELARIFQELNDCENAIPHLKARLETEKSYTTYADLGDAYLKCEDWRNAIDVYRSALEYSDNAPRAYFGLAMALAADGQEKEAARAFKKVIKYAPGSDYAQQAQEWLDGH